MESLGGFVERVALAAQMAIILEVSSYPKPGNVSRYYDYPDTKFDHFLVGGVAVGPPIRRAALRGVRAALGRIPLKSLRIGFYIEECIRQSRSWHRGGNTNLGTVALLVPIAMAAGFLQARNRFTVERLGGTVRRMVRASTVEDAVAFYRAVRLADPGGLGSPPEGFPDVLSPSFARMLRRRRLTLLKVLEACAGRDSICRELVEGLPMVVGLGYPKLVEAFQRLGDVNKAIVQAFLELLAARPDSFIARKRGIREAERVSGMAAEILSLGGVYSSEGWRKTHEMYEALKTADGSLNPGTTADLTAASIMLALLAGVKP